MVLQSGYATQSTSCKYDKRNPLVHSHIDTKIIDTELYLLQAFRCDIHTGHSTSSTASQLHSVHLQDKQGCKSCPKFLCMRNKKLAQKTGTVLLTKFRCALLWSDETHYKMWLCLLKTKMRQFLVLGVEQHVMFVQPSDKPHGLIEWSKVNIWCWSKSEHSWWAGKTQFQKTTCMYHAQCAWSAVTATSLVFLVTTTSYWFIYS